LHNFLHPNFCPFLLLKYNKEAGKNFCYTQTLYAIIFLSSGNITLGAINKDENLNFLLLKEGGRGVFCSVPPQKMAFYINYIKTNECN
jgi:hypothetical protein